jgi:hypothetical protein
MAEAPSSFRRFFPAISGLVGLLTPTMAWQAMALLASAEPRVQSVLDVSEARGVINLYFQFAATALATTGGVLAAVPYLKGGNMLARILAASTLITGIVAFAYIFLLGGSTQIPFDRYVHPGAWTAKFVGFNDFPPFDSALTWARGVPAVLSLLLGLTQLKKGD